MENARKYYRRFEKLFYVFFVCWFGLIFVPFQYYEYAHIITEVVKFATMIHLAASVLSYYETLIFKDEKK